MTRKIVIPSMVFAALLVLAEFVWLRGRQQAQRTARANEQVEEKIASARSLLREQHWNEAIHELESALDVEGATNGDTVYPLLNEARRGQAEALLDAAGIALAHRRVDDAQRLLRAYLAHSHAGRLDSARLLRDDLERALSDDEASRLLARLSEEELSVLAEKGQLTVDDGLHTEATRFFFQETLRRNVAKELRKRDAQREVARKTAFRRAAERARRIERLRSTSAFQSLATFLDRTLKQLHEQQQLASRQEAELRELFQALDVNDVEEQEKLRAGLLERPPQTNIREQIEHKRAEVKRAYRTEPGFSRSDGELFDRLVDQEVGRFLKTLPSS